jgi:hypothetical protein
VEGVETGHRRRLSPYLVELRPPELGWAELEALTGRARAAAAELRQAGRRVRFLRAVFVPEDEACYFLFEGDGRESVEEALTRAGLGPERFVETLPSGTGHAW